MNDDAVDDLAAIVAGAIAREDDAARVVGLAGDDVDLMAEAHEGARELVHPRGGGVGLGREVMREVGEAHEETGSVNRASSSSR